MPTSPPVDGPKVTPFPRVFSWMLPAVLLLVGFAARGGILPIPDQDIPSGKTLVVPIVASDPDGPPRSYSVTVGTPTTSGTPTAAAGIVATIRTGDPHLFIDVSYKPSVFGTGQFGAMEFQLLREFCPTTSQIIGGLAESGFYNPVPNGVPVSSYNFIDFFRVVPGFVIQGGDPNNNGSGGPGFAFENEFNSALIFSGTEGQLAMANAGTSPSGGTNGSQFFITLAPTRSLDYGYTIFGQLLRGYDTLNGIAGTPLEENESGTELSSPIFPVEINSVSISDNHTDAVLLLSATGVCDSVITVTATSPGSSAVASFTAHAVPDTTNDPPFLQPVPDSIARNGNLHLPLHGTDLQLDLLSYGYQSVLPLLADTATSGTSPLLALPLVSNTDNVFSATLEHYNPPEPYYEPDRRIFHLAAGDKSLAGSFTPIPFGFGRSLRLDKFPVAVFTAGNPKDTAADLTATVNWGDGTLLSGTDLGIVRETAFPTLNRFKVIASHDYQTSGEYPVIVDVSDRGGAHLTLTGTANVGSELIAIAARDIANIGGALRGEIVASVQDRGYAASAPSDFSTFIDWGDGTTSPGVLRQINDSSYQVLGNHTYRTSGTYTLCTVVSDSNSDDFSSAWGTASISGIKSPQLFPPFPQAHLAQMWSDLVTGSTTMPVSTGSDGENPSVSMIQGTDGYLYGTTVAGGNDGLGTVFKMTTTGSVTTLYNGNSYNGANPSGPLLEGTDGFLYGTTESGGVGVFGTVFQITTTGSIATIHYFDHGDGAGSQGGLVQDASGNLYGTTGYGGPSFFYGTVFSLTTSGSLTTLAAFNYNNGADSQAGLLPGADGSFCGTTSGGGSKGYGTVFQLSSSGSLTTLHSFTNGDDGGAPFAALILGTDGNLYGTANTGGSGSDGTIFEITTSGSLTTFHSFSGSDGSAPGGPLICGTDGNFYGTTSTGGSNGDGTVFQLTPGGTLTTLHSFNGSDGSEPLGGLVQATDGNLYGTASTGGTYGFGTAFEITTSGSLTTLHNFGNVATGYWVEATVTIVNSGNKTSPPGSFSAYVDPNGVLDGNQTIMTSGAQSSFAVPSLAPGRSWSFVFEGLPNAFTSDQAGTVVNELPPFPELTLPAGFNPTGQQIIGVVTYSDPVGDFDGSAKIISPGSF